MSPSSTTELHVSGMTCNNCARKVTEAAQKVPGVHSVAVSVAAAQASVRWTAPEQKDVPAVLAAISRAGFTAGEIRAGQPRQSRWQWPLIAGLAVTAGLMVGEWGFGLAMTPWFQWLALALAGGVQGFSGAPFYRGAWRQFRAGQSNMDTLVALGSTTAFGYSAWALLSGAGGHVFFMEAAAIISLVSAGHWLEARVSDQAGGTLKSLMKLAPQMARRVQVPAPPPLNLKTLSFSPSAPAHPPSAAETEVPVAALNIGDRIVLRPGDRVPVDGMVLEGESAVDEAMLTGESIPADKQPGSELFAGTVNLNGRLVLRVTGTGEATALAHIIAAVQRAQTSRADIQRIGDRVSNVFVPVVVAIALAAGLWWGLAFDSARQIHEVMAAWFGHAPLPAGTALAAAFIVAAAVLIVACPCAMGLATPAAIMAAANTAARRGILIRDGVALEKAGNITAVVFDKTGTLTMGKPEVAAEFEVGRRPPAVRSLAAALARGSTHPVSQAIARTPAEPVALSEWKEISGAGVSATLPASTFNPQPSILRLGALRWLQENGVDLAAGEAFVTEWSGQGATLVGLASGTSLLGLFALRDAVKANAAQIVTEIQRQGLKTFLVTGDNLRTAAGIAQLVGLAPEGVFAEVRPAQKAEFVKKLQSRGERVAFVGDGINDAPALTQADLGIAVGRASDVAREAADIILLKADLEAVPEALGLARATLRTIKQNLFWAFFYNALGIPLAALGFISPVFCAAAMGFSDLIVIGNALRLLRWRR